MENCLIMQERQRRWDLKFLSSCKFHSNWSKDPSTKCCAIVVRDFNKITSLGYNGYATGVVDDDSLNVREEKYARILHAEVNAIVLAQRSVVGNTLYVFPLAPCSACASVIIQSGITRVVTIQPDDLELRERWRKSNAVSSDMFMMADVELVIYCESEVE